jgi:hypothetical protein
MEILGVYRTTSTKADVKQKYEHHQKPYAICIIQVAVSFATSSVRMVSIVILRLLHVDKSLSRTPVCGLFITEDIPLPFFLSSVISGHILLSKNSFELIERS